MSPKPWFSSKGRTFQRRTTPFGSVVLHSLDRVRNRIRGQLGNPGRRSEVSALFYPEERENSPGNEVLK